MRIIDGNALAQELHASIEDELQVLRLSAVQPGAVARAAAMSSQNTVRVQHKWSDGVSPATAAERGGKENMVPTADDSGGLAAKPPAAVVYPSAAPVPAGRNIPGPDRQTASRGVRPLDSGHP